MPRSGFSRHVPRITIRTIAEKAGVSKASVSTVLNNRHVERRIPPATVERIRKATLQLGYLPNISARMLRSHGGLRNHVVVALVTSFEAPLRNNLPIGLRQAFAERRRALGDMSCSVLIEMFPAGRLSEMPGLLNGEHFNAAIITNTIPEDDRFLQENKLPFPVVLVNRQIPGYASVIEEPSAGKEAANALIEAGRKNLLVLHGNPLTQMTASRVAGFVREAQSRLQAPPVEIVAQNLSENSASDAMTHFLDRGGKLDGLYAVTDGMALGAYRALKQRTIRIPQNVAVVGIGDLDISNYFDPPLSTIGVPHDLVSNKACGMLLEQLEQSAESVPAPVVLPVQKIMRASIGEYFPEAVVSR